MVVSYAGSFWILGELPFVARLVLCICSPGWWDVSNALQQYYLRCGQPIPCHPIIEITVACIGGVLRACLCFPQGMLVHLSLLYCFISKHYPIVIPRGAHLNGHHAFIFAMVHPVDLSGNNALVVMCSCSFTSASGVVPLCFAWATYKSYLNISCCQSVLQLHCHLCNLTSLLGAEVVWPLASIGTFMSAMGTPLLSSHWIWLYPMSSVLK